MKDNDIIIKLNQAISSAKASLEAVEKWTEILAEKNDVELDSIKEKTKQLSTLEFDDHDVEENVVEGIFDGQNMIGPDGHQYPVPTNYASKSKLVEGDKLKLTIKPNGAFIYKQIELIPRQLKTGKLILEGSQYKVLCDEKVYSVLFASVTFYRAQVGDNVTIIVPEDSDSDWAAVENVLPAESTQEVA